MSKIIVTILSLMMKDCNEKESNDDDATRGFVFRYAISEVPGCL